MCRTTRSGRYIRDVDKVDRAVFFVLLAVSAVVWIAYPLDQRDSPGSLFPDLLLASGSAATVLVGLATALSAPPKTTRQLVLMAIAVASLLNASYTSAYHAFGTEENFGSNLSHVDALYFNIVTFSTTRYGDIAPRSQLARGLVTSQIAFGMIYLIVFVGLLLPRLGGPQQEGKA